MHFHLSSNVALASLASLLVVGSQVAAVPHENRPQRVSTVYQVPKSQPNAWLENLAVRPNGQILATRFDVPELWLIDPITGQGQIIYSFPNANALTGITHIGNDVYAVGAGTINHTNVVPTPGSFSIWSVNAAPLRQRKPATVKLITAIPESLFLNGIQSFTPSGQSTKRTGLIVADSTLGAIWLVDPQSGKYSLGWKDDSLAPLANSSIPIGINGIALHGNMLYYTLWTGGDFNKASVKVPSAASMAAGKASLVFKSGVHTLAATGGFFDDFAVSKDGTAYVTTNVLNTVVEIPAEGGAVNTLAGSIGNLAVAGSTAVAFTSNTERALYVSTGGGHGAPVNGATTEPGKIVKIVL